MNSLHPKFRWEFVQYIDLQPSSSVEWLIKPIDEYSHPDVYTISRYKQCYMLLNWQILIYTNMGIMVTDIREDG